MRLAALPESDIVNSYGYPPNPPSYQPAPEPVRVPEAAGEGRLMLPATADVLLAPAAAFGLVWGLFQFTPRDLVFLPMFLGCALMVSFVNHVIGTMLFRGSVGKLLLGAGSDEGLPRVSEVLWELVGMLDQIDADDPAEQVLMARGAQAARRSITVHSALIDTDRAIRNLRSLAEAHVHTRRRVTGGRDRHARIPISAGWARRGRGGGKHREKAAPSVHSRGLDVCVVGIRTNNWNRRHFGFKPFGEQALEQRPPHRAVPGSLHRTP
ncbi:hypothetical protein OIE68_20400 [Nocardia vinacea]|uniref:hypothetical protein n=1 Tax=Nocardia vinacea TaxID=96468 RepID=UPI002E10C406|nr:hypothetical protein OIE68_20400 [Nocardia vinacea]